MMTAVGFTSASCAAPEHAAGLVGERHVQGDDVGLAEHSVERREFGADFGGGFRAQEGIVGEHPHPEGPGTPRHFTAHPAGADQPQGLPVEFGAAEAGPVPLPCLHRLVRRRHLAHQRQQQRAGQLGRRDGVAGGRVHHRHALLGRGLDVDGVDPYAGAADHLEPGRAGQRLASDLGGAPHQHRVGVGDGRGELLALESGTLHQLEAIVAGERGEAFAGDLVGDQNA